MSLHTSRYGSNSWTSIPNIERALEMVLETNALPQHCKMIAAKSRTTSVASAMEYPTLQPFPTSPPYPRTYGRLREVTLRKQPPQPILFVKESNSSTLMRQNVSAPRPQAYSSIVHRRCVAIPAIDVSPPADDPESVGRDSD